MRWVTRVVGEASCIVSMPQVVGKQRPQFNGRQRRTYTPAKTERAEEAIASAWREQVGECWKGHDGPVAVEIAAEQPLAKSNAKYWAGRAFKGKPDADNIAKLVLDSLNELAYADDAQIVDMRVEKMPRTPFGRDAILRIHVTYRTETSEKETI